MRRRARPAHDSEEDEDEYAEVEEINTMSSSCDLTVGNMDIESIGSGSMSQMPGNRSWGWAFKNQWAERVKTSNGLVVHCLYPGCRQKYDTKSMTTSGINRHLIKIHRITPGSGVNCHSIIVCTNTVLHSSLLYSWSIIPHPSFLTPIYMYTTHINTLPCRIINTIRFCLFLLSSSSSSLITPPALLLSHGSKGHFWIHTLLSRSVTPAPTSVLYPVSILFSFCSFWFFYPFPFFYFYPFSRFFVCLLARKSASLSLALLMIPEPESRLFWLPSQLRSQPLAQPDLKWKPLPATLLVLSIKS
ncbi:MAG: hypothetical protein J3R72DRAFT_111893 [Linnemannia gamsii]|nr:MAG: hypothetical protein J3R72DRAFT_111893 [Linnemannia gamsii]